LELLDTMPDLEVYLMNTGQVGAAGDGDDRAKKVRISDSSAIVSAIVSGAIEWETDPDFGYEVAASVPDVDDIELLQPRRLYARQVRALEHGSLVGRLTTDRRQYRASYAGRAPAIPAGL